MSEYNPNEPKHLEMKYVHLKRGGVTWCGTANDCETHLQQWRDGEKLAYWFPACYDFLNIASIVKLESTSGKKSNVAYLLTVDTAAHNEIDDKQLDDMNAIFFSDNAEDTGDTEPPIILLFVQIKNHAKRSS